VATVGDEWRLYYLLHYHGRSVTAELHVV